MIVVTAELHSSITGEITTLGRLIIANDGTGTETIGHYQVFAGHKERLDLGNIYCRPQRQGVVRDHKRKGLSIWTLVRKALESLTY